MSNGDRPIRPIGSGSSNSSDCSNRSDRSARALARLLAAAALAHFALPGPFDRTIPAWLPGRARTWTDLSGAVEALLAAGVAVPRTRRVSAYAAAGFFAVVFPANVKTAYDWRHRAAPPRRRRTGVFRCRSPSCCGHGGSRAER